MEGIGLVELALTATAVVSTYTTIQNREAIANHVNNVGYYVSKRVQNLADDFDRNVSKTNSGKNFPKNRCNSTVETRTYCIVATFVLVATGLYVATHGGIDEPESNATSKLNLPTPTTTNTSTPTATSTNTPNCPPPYLACSSTTTPTTTLSPSTTPTVTSSGTSTTTPTPTSTLTSIHLSIEERRLLRKGLLE